MITNNFTGGFVPTNYTDLIKNGTFEKVCQTSSKTLEELIKQKSNNMTIYKVKDQVTVLIPLPGFTKEQVTIEIKGDELEVNATAPEEVKEEGKKIVWEGFKLKTVQKIVSLDKEMKYDNIEATFENGVLKVVLTESPKVYAKIDIK